MNKYAFKVRLCEGYQCDGHIMIEADSEDMAYDMALDYVCEKLYSALPELDIDVGVELDEYLTCKEGEKWLMKEIEEAKQYCKGELELDLFEHKEYGNCWYAMDYRKDLEQSMMLPIIKYTKPLITQEFAEEYEIDVRHYCDECNIFYVG